MDGCEPLILEHVALNVCFTETLDCRSKELGDTVLVGDVPFVDVYFGRVPAKICGFTQLVHASGNDGDAPSCTN